jgi:hypothetical protein
LFSDNRILAIAQMEWAPMAEIKAGSPFGMDSAMLAKIDWTLALKRVSHDTRTDFIYAPHL